MDFPTLAARLIERHGFSAYACESEEEARSPVEELARRRLWPCYFYPSDTTREKEVEAFSMEGEIVDKERYRDIGVIQWPPMNDVARLDEFLHELERLRRSGKWTRREILSHLDRVVPEFRHRETDRYLDTRM